MPWDAASFTSKHNHKLRGGAASKAAEQATAMVRKGVPEGIAIATANKTGDRMMEGQKETAYAGGGPVLGRVRSYAKGGEIEPAIWNPPPGMGRPPADNDTNTDTNRANHDGEA